MRYFNVEGGVGPTEAEGHLLGIPEEPLVHQLALWVVNSHLEHLRAGVNRNISCILHTAGLDPTMDTSAVTGAVVLNRHKRGEVCVLSYTLQ